MLTTLVSITFNHGFPQQWKDHRAFDIFKSTLDKVTVGIETRIEDAVDSSSQIGDSDFFFGSSLYNVRWNEFIQEIAPELAENHADILLSVAGSSSISPTIFLSLIMTDGRYRDSNTDEIFRRKMKRLAGRLSYSYYESTDRHRPQQNQVTYSLWKVLGKDEEKLNDLIRLYHLLSEKINGNDEYTRSVWEAYSTIEYEYAVRDIESDGTLVFPFPEEECWQIGPSHHSDYCPPDKCVQSSLDLSPSLYTVFGEDFSYYGSSGIVIASHRGRIHKLSPCKLAIIDYDGGEYQTWYSHIRIDANNFQHVEKGDRIGYIETEQMKANCDCDPKIGLEECTKGPHVHWSVREFNGKPKNIMNLVVSGYLSLIHI